MGYLLAMLDQNLHIRNANEHPVSEIEWARIRRRNRVQVRLASKLLHQEKYRGRDIQVKFTGRFIKGIAMPKGPIRVRAVSGPMASKEAAIAWAKDFIDQHIAWKIG
jgi:hypothetical protein